MILRYFIFIMIVTTSIHTASSQVPDTTRKLKPVIVVHGGAGNLKKLKLSALQEEEYKAALGLALKTGYAILKAHGSCVDAAEAALRILEDSPLFNAGKGSVFTHDGRNEMDAAIMSGKNLRCGAVAGVCRIKNPISAARQVMEDGNFVFLSGSGAEEFARSKDLEIVDTTYFHTPERWEQLQKAIEKNRLELDLGDSVGLGDSPDIEQKFGTVGCVALDEDGNLAAATSTGGIVNKKFGRIGDSPIIGAGTYADNRTCAISCTGKGEDFIRLNVAYDISALMKYKNLSLKAASDYVIKTKLVKLNGRGGCIGIDKKGNICMPFTTTGMYRGHIDKSGLLKIEIY